MKKTVKAIIQYKDLYFLQLRDNNNKITYPNCWSFFGGRLLLKENPTTGLVRELLEELFQLDFIKILYKHYINY